MDCYCSGNRSSGLSVIIALNGEGCPWMFFSLQNGRVWTIFGIQAGPYKISFLSFHSLKWLYLWPIHGLPVYGLTSQNDFLVGWEFERATVEGLAIFMQILQFCTVCNFHTFHLWCASRCSCSAPDEINPKELKGLLRVSKGMDQVSVFPHYSTKLVKIIVLRKWFWQLNDKIMTETFAISYIYAHACASVHLLGYLTACGLHCWCFRIYGGLLCGTEPNRIAIVVHQAKCMPNRSNCMSFAIYYIILLRILWYFPNNCNIEILRHYSEILTVDFGHIRWTA